MVSDALAAAAAKIEELSGAHGREVISCRKKEVQQLPIVLGTGPRSAGPIPRGINEPMQHC
jgi:hypothetical protein